MIYIKFRTDEILNDAGQPTGNPWPSKAARRAVIKLLTKIIPQANQDFDSDIYKVRQWILEVDEISGTMEREIGLDDKGDVIMIMPWNNNCGFWTDSSVEIEDLAKSQDLAFGGEEEFNILWDEFGKNR